MAKPKPNVGAIKRKPTLAIEMWPVGKPKPYGQNARKLSDQAVAKCAASIKEFGWRQPIVVDKKGVVIAGHTRLLAARHLGLTEVPVHVASNLTPAQVKAYRLADNRTAQENTWDLDLLGPELLELQALDLDLSLTGFDAMEIREMLEGVTPEWTGMPEFEQADQMAWQTVKIHLSSAADRGAFSELIGQPITDHTKYLWHPKAVPEVPSIRQRWDTATPQNPQFPVYVISKGRWESRLTSKVLEAINVPYRIVVEPQEVEKYAEVIDSGKILTLPFSDLGQGSIPARNWVWEHSISEGARRHWILDDNIRTFYRLHNNQKVRVDSGTIFRAAEDFIERYENVGLAGFNYQWLAKQRQDIPPFLANTRIYSCILIDNSLKHRWRGRYNEDTDLSLRVLKDHFCTVQFNAFLADKQSTMTMKGGNTDELYQGDGRLKMAESLRDQHPDVVTIVRKWNRWQHQVDYRPFKDNKFIPRAGVSLDDLEVNNYGMELKRVAA